MCGQYTDATAGSENSILILRKRYHRFAYVILFQKVELDKLD